MEPGFPSTPGGVQQPIMAQVVPDPSGRGPRKRSRIWLPILLVLVLLLLGGIIVAGVGAVGLLGAGALGGEDRVRETHFSHNPYGSDKVVIISIEGAILTGEGFFQHEIDRAVEDKRVKAVVLRVNSPGGTVSASDYMYHHLSKLAKERDIPLVVSMGGIAASGGYYVSMAVGDQPDTIFAEPTTWTGSIGVIMPHYDLSEMLNEHWGVKEDSIASHRLKGMGSLAKPMTKEERDIFQGLVDDAFARFKKVVQQGRPKFQQNPKALEQLATGQVFTADQALENGLVDKIGFLDDAVDRAIALAGLDKEEVEVVKYKPELSLADVLLGAKAQAPSLDLAALLDMATPRAYYLWTRLPPLAASGRTEGQ